MQYQTTGSVTNRIELFEKKLSPDKRPPSPGMAMNMNMPMPMSMPMNTMPMPVPVSGEGMNVNTNINAGLDSNGVYRRPPSPGMSPLTSISNRMGMGNAPLESPHSAASPKRRPAPGGGAVVGYGPPSPGGSLKGSSKAQQKPSPGGKPRKRAPSPGMNSGGININSSPNQIPSPRSPRRQPVPGNNNGLSMPMNEYNLPVAVGAEPKRFVFSAEPTGVTPSQIQISSQPQQNVYGANENVNIHVQQMQKQMQMQQMNGNNGINGQQMQMSQMNNQMQMQPQIQPQMNGENRENIPAQHQSLSKKNYNPVRNNPLFLQRMTEADDSDDEEHEIGERNDLQKIAQVAAALENSNAQHQRLLGQVESDADVDVDVDLDDSHDNNEKEDEHPTPMKFTAEPISQNPPQRDKFAHPAKHWVNLRRTNNEKKKKQIHSSDALLQKFTHAPAVVTTSDASIATNDTRSVSSLRQLSPGKKAVVEKLRKARGRQSKQSISPKRRARDDGSSESIKSLPRSPRKSQSPSTRIIKPAAIKASGPIFFPPNKRNNNNNNNNGNNGDDSSLSSYSAKSFSSAVSRSREGGKRGGSLAQKVQNASRSPRKYRSNGETNKSKNEKDTSTADHLNVKKGMNLIQEQNIVAKKLESFEEYEKKEEASKSNSKQSLSRLNSNLARLKVLKEEQRMREEERERQQTDDEKPQYHYLTKRKGSIGGKKHSVADDEFTVDCEEISTGDISSQSTILSVEHKSPEKNIVEHKKKKNNMNKNVGDKTKQQSQWAVIMQNRLGEVSDEESSFEDEFKQEPSWDVDSPARPQGNNNDNNVSPIKSPKKSSPHPSHPFDSIEIPIKSPVKTPRDIDLSISDIAEGDIPSPFTNNEMHIKEIQITEIQHSDDDGNVADDFYPDFAPPLKQMALPPRTKAIEDIPRQALNPSPSPLMQPIANQNEDINPYVGPYAQLLPRSTNPWIIKTNLPTLSSSLTNTRTIQPPHLSIPSHDSFFHNQLPIHPSQEPNNGYHDPTHLQNQLHTHTGQDPNNGYHDPAHLHNQLYPQTAQEQNTFFPDSARHHPQSHTQAGQASTNFFQDPNHAHGQPQLQANPENNNPYQVSNTNPPGYLGVNATQQVQYPDPGIAYRNQDPYAQHGFSSTEESSSNHQAMKPDAKGGKSVDEFVLSRSTPDSDASFGRKVDNEKKKGDESTLLGQDHIPSTDSEDQSKTSETLSRWWENNYAATQNKDVNNVVKQALSEINDAPSPMKSPGQIISDGLDLDSDDDIFSGLESPRNQPGKRKSKKVAIDEELDKFLNEDKNQESKDTAATRVSSAKKKKKNKPKLLAVKEEDQGEYVEKMKVKSKVAPEETYNEINVSSSDSTSRKKSKKVKNKKKSSKSAGERDRYDQEESPAIGRVSSRGEERRNVQEEIPAVGRVSSRTPSRGGIFNSYACGILDPISSQDSGPSERHGKRNSRRQPRDDDTYDDSTLYTNDYTSYSSRCGSIGGQTNDSQTYDSRLHLSEKERKVWDAWDRKDNESTFTGASRIDNSSLVSKEQKKEINNERRSRAHEKLLMHAYIALSKPPPEVMREKGEGMQPNDHQTLHEEQTVGQTLNSSQTHEIDQDNSYVSDAENQVPPSFHNDENNNFQMEGTGHENFQFQSTGNDPENVDFEHSFHDHNENFDFQPLGSGQEDFNMQRIGSSQEHSSHQPSKSLHSQSQHSQSLRAQSVLQDAISLSANTKESSIVSNKTGPVPILRKPKSIVFQKHVLEKFCVRIKHSAIQVLKLNREKKWQTRYLTVSKEGTWLKNNNKSDACFCPLGLLWVKKFSKSKEHSVLTIDKQGRGGMLLANIVRASLIEDYTGSSSLTKRQLEKYHDSIIIKLQGTTSMVTLRCERNDAEAISVGCNAMIDVLRGSKNGNASRPRSAQSRNSRGMSGSVASQFGTHTSHYGSQSIASNHLSKTYVTNDLWEA